MTNTPKITQSMIAQDLGLSQALISKVLNGIRERVDPETYDRVWEHALKVGYAAKGMSSRATVEASSVKQVGLVLRTGIRLFSHSSIFRYAQEGLQEALGPRGFSTVFLGTEELLDAQNVPPMPGIVAFGLMKPSFIKNLSKRTPRLVTVNSTYPGCCHSVCSNESQALDLLVEHLALLGHKTFGWIGGVPRHGRYDGRQRAFEEALRSRDLPLPTPEYTIIIPTGAERQEGRDGMAKFLAAGPASGRPTAVVTFNGMMARGAVNFALQSGLRLPQDLSISAVDATPVCSEEEPHITCGGTVPQKLGDAAARLILETETGPEGAYHDLVLGAQLFTGTTTGKAGR